MVDQVTEDQMSPEASPGELSRKSGVRRVNNLPVYLVGGVMTVFLAIMVPVSYTHLDVYKRQPWTPTSAACPATAWKTSAGR